MEARDVIIWYLDKVRRWRDNSLQCAFITVLDEGTVNHSESNRLHLLDSPDETASIMT